MFYGIIYNLFLIFNSYLPWSYVVQNMARKSLNVYQFSEIGIKYLPFVEFDNSLHEC